MSFSKSSIFISSFSLYFYGSSICNFWEGRRGLQNGEQLLVRTFEPSLLMMSDCGFGRSRIVKRLDVKLRGQTENKWYCYHWCSWKGRQHQLDSIHMAFVINCNHGYSWPKSRLISHHFRCHLFMNIEQPLEKVTRADFGRECTRFANRTTTKGQSYRRLYSGVWSAAAVP